ncbi:MAG: hypothetical protein HKN07_07385 [Acidimicrobiia bacterium]|nr:hypothetical protein [Acidimicrobiia bacterium]
MHIGLVASPADAHAADQVATELSRVEGFDLVEPNNAETVIVIISERSARDDTWIAAVTALTASRIVPIAVALERALPHPNDLPNLVRPINWIIWDDPADFPTPELLAALTYRPEDYRLATQIDHEAEAWRQSGFETRSLIDDPRRINELEHLWARQSSATLRPLTELTSSFLQHSMNASRRTRGKRRLRRVIGIVVAAVALTVAVPVLLQVRSTSQLNRTSFAASASLGQDRDVPTWAAVSAAATLAAGEGELAALAGESLRDLLVLPWPVDYVQPIGGSTWAIQPIDSGDRVAILRVDEIGDPDYLSIREVDSARELAQVPLDGSYDAIAPDADERRLVAAGSSGVVVVDIASRSVRRVIDDPTPAAWFVDDEFIAVSKPGRIDVVDLDGIVIRSIELGDGDEVVGRGYGNGSSMAVTRFDRTYTRVSLDSGERLDANVEAPPIGAAATIGLDGETMFVLGPDRQVWTVDRNGEGRPLGLNAPESTYFLQEIEGGRLVVASQSMGVVVYHLESAVELGTVCRDVALVQKIQVDQDGEMVACVAPATFVVWPLPIGPIPALPEDALIFDEVEPGSVDALDIDGASRPRGSLSRIAAAFSSADDLVVIFDDGYIETFDMTADGQELAFRTSIPALGSVTGIAWSPSRPLFLWARIGDQWWPARDCPGCTNPASLLRAFVHRQRGCYLNQQLADVSSETRSLLGLLACEDV